MIALLAGEVKFSSQGGLQRSEGQKESPDALDAPTDFQGI